MSQQASTHSSACHPRASNTATSTTTITNPQHDKNTHQRIYRNSKITDYHTPEMSKTNIPYGDSVTTKEDSTIRLYFQNVNGIRTENSWDKWTTGLQHAEDMHVDIICASETNIRWNSHNLSIGQSTTKKIFPFLKIGTSHCYDTHSTSTYQPGGTITIITNRWTNRVTGTANDTSGMGRWSGHILRTKNNHSIYILTAYCPNKDNKFGTNTNYQQLWRWLRSNTTDHNIEPNPRKTMLKDLRDYIQKIHSQGDQVILAWDTNDSMQSPSIIEFMADCNLKSLMKEAPAELTTYTRGQRIIDHIMGSSTIAPTTQSGYLAFYDGAWHSDHRALYVDFTSDLLFGSRTVEPQQPTTRKLVSTNGQNVQRFINNIARNKHHNIDTIYGSIKELEDISQWTSNHNDKLEAQDIAFTAMLLHAETKLPSKSSTPWSPELHEAHQITQYWIISSSQKRNNIQTSQRHAELDKALGDKKYMGNKFRPPHIQLKRAKNNLQIIRNNATIIRNRFLTIRQEEMVLKDEKKKAKIVQNIIRAEQRQRSFKSIKNKLQPHRSSGGISYIIVPDSAGNHQRIEDTDIMEQQLHDRNRKHFSQAHGTPFTVDPIRSTIGWSGANQNAIDLINGTPPPAETHPAATAIIAACNQVREPLSHHFPAIDMLNGFKKWRESTTTSPSGKHLGIYKSIRLAYIHGLTADTESTSEEDSTDTSIAFKLVYIQNGLINLAILHCHTYNRWKTVHNFFLEKLPGYPLIEKLRVIHIYEADWNLILKYFISHKLLRAATENETTTTEQSGGRPNRSAINEATKTVILYETCRIQRRTGGIMYNDAKACFDRVIENLSNMSCLREGLAPEIARLHSHTFDQIKYYIKHKNGIAATPNGNNKPDPFYGVGQGSGDAGARWGLVSDCIIRAYNKQSHQAIIQGPISFLILNEKCQLFVDDSRLFILITSDNGYTIKELLQHDTQVWEQLLFASGGKLELTKCKYCVFSWTKQADGYVTLNNQYNTNPIQLASSETNQQMEVESISVDASYKLLGVQIAFTANTTQQAESFRTKCTTFANLFNQLNLPHAEAHAGYIGVALPSIRYPLPATSIPNKVIRKSQKPFISALLPKLGFNRKFPRSVVFAPKKFGGLGLLDFATEQSIYHVTTLISNLRSNTSMTTNCIQLIESYQVLAGTTESPLVNTAPITYIDPKLAPWIEVCRTFLHSINASITTPNIPSLYRLREHDAGIMQLATQTYQNIPTLKVINNCRLYLQVTTIAEISSSDGLYILPSAIYGTADDSDQPTLHTTTSTSTIQWPIQHRPPASSWTVWKTFLTTILKPTTAASLQQPLGNWIGNPSKHRTWKHYHTKYHNIIVNTYQEQPIFYRQNINKLSEYNIINPSEAQHLTQQINDVSQLVPSTPTTTTNNNIITLTTTTRASIPRIIQAQATSEATPESTAATNATHCIEPQQRIHLHCVAIHEYDTSYFKWSIRTTSDIIAANTGKPLPSSTDNRVRAETTGVIEALRTYQAMLNNPSSQISATKKGTTWWTSNKTLLRKVKQIYQPSPTQTLEAEHENICTIRNLLQDLPYIQVKLVPQSKRSDPTNWHHNVTQELIVEANIDTPQRDTCRSTYPDKGHIATLQINRVEVSANYMNELRNAAQFPEYSKYLSSKHPTWQHTTGAQIDWKVHNLALNRLSYTQQKTTRQYIHDWLPVNNHPGLSYTISPICPQCNRHNETQQHFMTCDAPQASDTWTQSTVNIRTKAMSMHIDPSLIDIICEVISNRNLDFQPDTAHLDRSYRTLIDQQSKIGWQEILKGRLSKQWVLIQNRFQSNHQGHLAISKLIHLIYIQMLTAWKTRCDIQHGMTQLDRDNKIKHQIQPKVEALYRLIPQLDSIDQQFFSQTIAEILTKPLRALEDWLKLATTQIREGIRRATARQIAKTHSILKYFRPTTPTAPIRTNRHNQSTRKIRTTGTATASPETQPPPDQHIQNPITSAPSRTEKSNYKDP